MPAQESCLTQTKHPNHSIQVQLNRGRSHGPIKLGNATQKRVQMADWIHHQGLGSELQARLKRLEKVTELTEKVPEAASANDTLFEIALVCWSLRSFAAICARTAASYFHQKRPNSSLKSEMLERTEFLPETSKLLIAAPA